MRERFGCSEIEICYEQKVMTLIWRVDVGSKLTVSSKHDVLDGWLRFTGGLKLNVCVVGLK